MEYKEVESLLHKYLEGTASNADSALLESWYLEQNAKEKTDLSPQEFSEDLLLIRQGLPLQGKVRKMNPWRMAAAVAAALLIFFIGYQVWRDRPGHIAQEQLATLKAPSAPRQHTLADGSIVWVNAGSALKYPERFTGSTREVYLSGEAYFDIEHNANKPFIIHTGNVTTTVLGTAFNIREDHVKHTIAVTVTRGKVSVTSGNQLLGIVSPNRQLSFNTVNQETNLRTVNAAQAIAWQKIDLKFEDVSFDQAVKTLEERFGVKIKFANDKLKNCRFTGASLNGQKLEDVLKTICDFNNAAFQTKPDGSIIIYGPGC
jgi:transmembrane sensor